MKFKEKHPEQRTEIEQELLDLAQCVITQIRPDNSQDPTAATALRSTATETYRQLLELDTDDDRGYLEALKLSENLRRIVTSYQANETVNTETIVFSPLDEQSLSDTIEQACIAATLGKELIIQRGLVSNRVKGAWGEQCQLTIGKFGRHSISFTEYQGGRSEESTYLPELRELFIPLGYYHSTYNIRAHVGSGETSEELSEQLQKAVDTIAPGCQAIRVAVEFHDYGGIQLDFGFSPIDLNDFKTLLTVLLKAIQKSAQKTV